MTTDERPWWAIALDTDTVYWLCNRSLLHRGKHQCDCICVLPHGHDGGHKCAVEYP